MLLALAACAPLPPAGTPRVEQRPSPNFDARRPNFVILHHTGSADAERAARWLTDPQSKVSAHYLIARDGRVVQMVDERERAWHAGVSFWGGLRDLNSASIGIELDNDGSEEFAEAQIAALLPLLAAILPRHGIPAANVLGHADVAPGRKVDPGPRFPWARLAAAGFGLWCARPLPPRDGDDQLLLAAFGYDVAEPAAAAAAFKLHFAPDEPGGELTGEDRAVLACLLEQRRARAP